jgi:hypothetical protein
MAFRIKAVVQAFSLYAQLQYQGPHGSLTMDEEGIRLQEKKHSWAWKYQDIQQLTISERRLTILTYSDNKWKLGADRQHEFELAQGTFEDAYVLLKDKLDQRFVAALADKPAAMLWEIPVKHLRRITGTEGVLSVTPDHIIYKTDHAGESRTWRYRDIENISSTGPFEFTITTHERSRAHYGGLKTFHFQLKEPLERERYDDLWRRLNASRY